MKIIKTESPIDKAFNEVLDLIEDTNWDNLDAQGTEKVLQSIKKTMDGLYEAGLKRASKIIHYN